MDLAPLTTALRSRLGYTPVSTSHTPKQIRLLGRLPANRMGDWLAFIHHIHVNCLERLQPMWTVDISKLYFTKPDTKVVIYGWRLIFQIKEGVPAHIPELVPQIVNAVNSAPRSSRSEVTEMPLVGSRAGDPLSPTGKGAGLSEKTPVGPLALQARNR